MKFHPAHFFFVFVGVAIGVIISLQIRARPISSASSPVHQIEIQKSLLSTFVIEQDDLKKKLDSVKTKLDESKKILEQRSSRQTRKTLERLKSLTSFDRVTEEGIRMTLSDNPAVTRISFSAINENFVQASDLRDIANLLFLMDAKAIAINGKRITPLTPIQAIFDSILVGNFRIASPFIITAIGYPQSLIRAADHFTSRKIHMFVEPVEEITIEPAEFIRSLKFASIAKS